MIQLGRFTGRPVQPLPFHFGGENVLKVENTLLVGKNQWRLNGLELPGGQLDHESVERLELEMKSAWGVKNLLWLGNRKLRQSSPRHLQAGSTTLQPFFHLDLFLLPITEKLCLVGKISPTCIIDASGPHLPIVEQIDQELKLIRSQLEETGINTLPIPLPIQFEQGFLKIYSPLNGWCDFYSTGPYCLLPAYRDLPAKARKISIQNETQVTQILHNAGIQVRFLAGNFGASAKRAGSLHCKTNVINRIAPWR